MSPLFSIVIANYNYGRFLEDAIKSVIAQDMGDLVELIVCDAASTDNSVEVIRKYNRYIAWWCSEKDGGQSAAFNKGFSHATGRFLTWLNADDIFTRGALKAVAKAIEKHPRCEWFAGSSLWTDADLKIERCFCAHRFSRIKARWNCISVGGPSSFFTKRLLESVGGVDESLHYVMDTDLWYKFYRVCGVRYCRTKHNVFAYRQHEASKMSGADHSETERALNNRLRAICESRRLNERHNLQTGWRSRLAHLLTLSVIDNIIALGRTFRLRGMDAREI